MFSRGVIVMCNWVLMLVPVGFIWFLLVHQYPQYFFNFHDYLMLFRWGHL